MLNKLLLSTALSGLMLSSAMAQAPSPSSSSPSSTPPSASAPASPSGSSNSDAMKSDATKADATKPDATKAEASKPSSSASASASTISSQSPNQMLVSNLKGVDVMGNNNEKIGDISDILVSKDGKVEAYLLSIGGFLGVGAKEVALNPSSVQLTQENNTWKAKVDMSKEQLAQAPDFKRHEDRTTTGASSAGSGPASKPRPAPGGGTGGSAK
jgi:sporulation protein YlmC with PRC-barrel domain